MAPSERAVAVGGLRTVALAPIANPYLDELRVIAPDIEVPWMDRWRTLPATSHYEARAALTRRYAWGIPNEVVIRTIAAAGPVVEVFAGTGYWASLVAAAGGDIVATDVSPGFSTWTAHEPYYPVARENAATTAKRYPNRALMLVWPTMDEGAALALRAYQGAGVIYVGECAGGCCASDNFFERLDADFEEEREIDIPQWWGLHDAAYFYRRKPKGESDL